MNYSPPSPPMIAARWKGGVQTPNAIVMHGTVSPCVEGGARSTAQFFATEGNPTSAHYVVDPGEVVQCVGDHTVAYHCGYNQNSIGIEMTDPEAGPASRWKDADHAAMLGHAATLAAGLCLAYGIEVRRPTVAELKAQGPHGIYGHNDSRLAFGNTTHTDPIDFPWPHFISLVKAEVARLSTTGRQQVPKQHQTRGAAIDNAIGDLAGTKKGPGKRGTAIRTALRKLRSIASWAK